VRLRQALEGVEQVSVDLETGIAALQITAEDQLAAFNSLPRLCEAINDVGFKSEPYFGEEASI
jgi:hypothetical protein